MKRWIVMWLVAAAAAGCNQSSPQQLKQDAQLRWQQTRAKVAFGVAQEQFNSGQLDRAMAKVQEALGLNPQDSEARLLLGKIYIEQGHYALAQTELKKVCEEAHKSHEAVFMLGVAQERSGHLDDALASYRKAQGLDPSTVSAAVAAGEVLVAMGRFDEAQVYVNGYLPSAGEEPGIFELAGRLAMMQEDYPLAARDYGQAVDLDPENVRYREALGQALFLSGQFGEAGETLRTLMRLPKYTAPAWVQTLLGDCYMALNQPQEARQAFAAARDLEPAESRAWSNVAKAALAAGDAPRAIASAQEALRQESPGLDAFLLLGYALLKEGQAQRAATVLSGAVEKFPQHILLQCLLGKAYAASGDVAQAVRCYTAALRLEPDNPLPKELLAAASAGRSAPVGVEAPESR
jgi:tetratricopeptide (TPR) repeat protein